MSSLDLINAIRRLVGDRGVVTGPDDMAPYLMEQRGRFTSQALAVVRPGSTEQVAGLVRLCADARVGIVPQGGNTGLVGGSVAREDQIIVNLARMNRVRELDAANYTLTAEAGCILANLQCAALDAGRFFPLSLGAEGSCQIGGNLATNAGGVNVLHYGNARELTLGLEVVLPDGRIYTGLEALRKNNTGYDLKNLFVGAEGTLGIITAAVLKLFPAPADTATAVVGLSNLDACVTLLAHAREHSGDRVVSFELMSRFGLDLVFAHVPGCRNPFAGHHNWYVLMAMASPAADAGVRTKLESVLAGALEDGLISDAVLSENEAQTRSMWRLREAIVEAQAYAGASISHDVSVRVADVPRFVTEATERVTDRLPGIRVCAFGHAGDGNIHFNLSQPEGMDRQTFQDRRSAINEVVHDVVHRLGGSFSAEHGIGLLKLDEMGRYKSSAEVDLMRAIKQALDARGIMNPGKVLP